jgi:type I restriction enzyme S subunit
MLQSKGVQDELKSRSTGTTVSGIRQSELRLIQLPIPSIGEQRLIANILGSLDDKIELNRKMNETLEAMARALFKSWFVDFDPVRAKVEGRNIGLPEAIAALFPDSFEESDLGDKPQGWANGTFDDVAENSRITMRVEKIPADTPYIGLDHMPRRSIALSEWGKSDGLASGKAAFNAKNILFGKLRPYFHKVGIAPVDGVCSTDIVVIVPKEPDWYGFVLQHASSDVFVAYTNSGSTGTKMPRTSWAEMARYPLVLPPLQLVQEFNRIVAPTYDQIIALIHESRTLSALRDALLPKLISGEIRLKGISTAVAE